MVNEPIPRPPRDGRHPDSPAVASLRVDSRLRLLYNIEVSYFGGSVEGASGRAGHR
jgi:hypothetical protein